MSIFLLYKITLFLRHVQQLLLCVCRFLSLFLSGRITLKVIFYYFHHYIFKVYKYSSHHFEKPNRALFQQYRAAPIFLHLKQWRIANEAESLILIQYATKPRNPE
jgi:hypothetical protein